ncbi:MAG: flagellar basal body rod protein FlgC [Pseudomonadota bacterium]
MIIRFITTMIIFLAVCVGANAKTNRIQGLPAAREKSKAALKANAERLNIIAENLANKDTTGLNPNELPYTRKILHFKNEYDPNIGTTVVKVDKVKADTKPYEVRYEPGHPAASAAGYVLYPNVREVVEVMDSKETKRLYEANLEAYKTTQNLIQRTMDIIR